MDIGSANRVAVVTGASSTGIGGAIARRLASSDWSLFLTSIDDDDLGVLRNQCRTGGGASVSGGTYDFTQDGSLHQMVADAIEAHGRIDVLINNAALRDHKPFGEYSSREFDEVVAVNLRAPFLASQAVVPIMRRQGEGRIIHVGSQLGVVAAESLALYSATKAALISLTRSMALELARDGISVNAVSPGPTATGHMQARFEAHPEVRDALVAKMPLGRLGEPGEVAEAVCFLATSDGRLMQGHNLIIDGGYTVL